MKTIYGPGPLVMVVAMIGVVLWLISCTEIHDETPELAPFMGAIQVYSMKLGYSIQAKNKRLALFYLEEIEEVLHEVQEEVPEHEGFPLANLVQIIAEPEIEKLEADLQTDNWPRIGNQYRLLIDGCNRCHSATEHEFLIMTPSDGRSPFNQRFDIP